jgi:hypothetical protein
MGLRGGAVIGRFDVDSCIHNNGIVYHVLRTRYFYRVPKLLLADDK